ncbi:hypothetical protein OKW29_004381 [Paraburkholderia sp. CI3]
MEKAIAHPTDSRLLERCREHLVKAAVRHGLKLRQNYNREAPRLALQFDRYAHATQSKRMRKACARCAPGLVASCVTCNEGPARWAKAVMRRCWSWLLARSASCRKSRKTKKALCVARTGSLVSGRGKGTHSLRVRRESVDDNDTQGRARGWYALDAGQSAARVKQVVASLMQREAGAPLSPYSTGLASRAAMPSASAVRRTRYAACSAASLSCTSQPTILRLYRSRIRYR